MNILIELTNARGLPEMLVNRNGDVFDNSNQAIEAVSEDIEPYWYVDVYNYSDESIINGMYPRLGREAFFDNEPNKFQKLWAISKHKGTDCEVREMWSIT